MDSAEVIWKRYQVGNMKGDNGRSIGSSGRYSNSMLTNLPRCTMSLGAETAQQLHQVVVMFRRRMIVQISATRSSTIRLSTTSLAFACKRPLPLVESTIIERKPDDDSERPLLDGPHQGRLSRSRLQLDGL